MCRISSRARGSRAPEGRRNELTGLIAAEGACPVRLDVLTEPEAQQLLAGRLGAGRVAAEAAAYRGDRTVRASPAGPGDRGCSGGYPPDVDWARSQQVALAAAARRLGDDAAQALALRSLGEALTRLGSWQDARSHLLNSLTMYANLRDDTGQASCHYGMALLSGSQGDHARALDHAQHALRLYRAADDLAGQASALNGVGWDYALLGNNQRALRYCNKALELYRGAGNRIGEALTLESLGFFHHQAGRHGQAIKFYQQALRAYTDIDDRHCRANTLIRLGGTHQASGNLRAAHDNWQQAAKILDDLHHHDAEAVRARLQETTVTPSGLTGATPARLHHHRP